MRALFQFDCDRKRMQVEADSRIEALTRTVNTLRHKLKNVQVNLKLIEF